MTAPDDKPTARALHLELDRLTGDEVDLLSRICEAVAQGDRVVALGPTQQALERVALKLKAHRAGKPPTEAA